MRLRRYQLGGTRRRPEGLVVTPDGPRLDPPIEQLDDRWFLTKGAAHRYRARRRRQGWRYLRWSLWRGHRLVDGDGMR